MLPAPHLVLPQTQEAMLHSAHAVPAQDSERTPRYGRGSPSSPEHSGEKKETTPTTLPLCDTAVPQAASTSPSAGLALKKRPTAKAKDGETRRSTRRRGECKDKRIMERSRPAPAWLTGSAPAIHPPPPSTHFFPQLISQVRTVPVTRPDSTSPASSSTLKQRRASVPSVVSHNTGRVAEDEQPIDVLRLAAYLAGGQSSAPGPLGKSQRVGGLYVDPIYTAVSPSPSPSPDAYPSSTPPASSTDCSASTPYLSSTASTSTAPNWASSPVLRRASEPNTASSYTPLHAATPSTINTVSTSHTTTFQTPRQVSSCTAPWASVPIPSSAASSSAGAMFGSWQGWQGQGQGYGGWTLPTVTERHLLDGEASASKWRTSTVSVGCHPYILPSPMDMGWTSSSSTSSSSEFSGGDSQRNSISSTAGPSTPGSTSPYLYPSFYDFASGASGSSAAPALPPAPAPIPAVEPTYPSQASYLPAPPSYPPEPPMGTYLAPSQSNFSSDHAFSSYHWPASTSTAPTSTSTCAAPLAPPPHLPPPHVAPTTTTTVPNYPNYPSAPLSPPPEQGVYKLPPFPAPLPPLPATCSTSANGDGDGSAPAWSVIPVDGRQPGEGVRELELSGYGDPALGMEGVSGMDGMGHSSAPGGKVYNYQDTFLCEIMRGSRGSTSQVVGDHTIH
ncbi:hypothetical protein L198_05418 [Cryptococcus wingfieldii CBS 7118]|uniref:Uncharacterized protein n=1 Tax=Cryptococcus wingfieldii CBS 7118 TaxID=1295528 RepID=A0A1E3IY40_9TREE|nr:hypothetical protein L198_05418 [Cryptococcus wingfieldii CBS 7118]ODN93553.1 hypothetical protein L198_05418 [Cryptococcus wingfieldii CBS 7118]